MDKWATAGSLLYGTLTYNYFDGWASVHGQSWAVGCGKVVRVSGALRFWFDELWGRVAGWQEADARETETETGRVREYTGE